MIYKYHLVCMKVITQQLFASWDGPLLADEAVFRIFYSNAMVEIILVCKCLFISSFIYFLSFTHVMRDIVNRNVVVQ